MKKKYRPILKWILLSLLLLLFYLIERYGLSRIRLFSVSPQIVPVAVAVVALFEGGFGGAAFGLAAGLILDADSLRFDGYFSIVLLLGGTLIGILCTYMFRKNFLNALFMSL
ncbi:rod shape-determining protein MreD, partial [Oscillospiraceae bacterium OttesenSCG-928-G22]|nr:rod shape-determining protein MreD [Oscillospiraceae bacterium OttesenSCG-928-G22]